MGFDGRPLFDLNEPPAEVEEELNKVVCLPQKAIPSLHSQASDLFTKSVVSQRIRNNFSHASSLSGFQPFFRLKSVHGSEERDLGKLGDLSSRVASSCSGEGARVDPPLDVGSLKNQHIEREEGEWSDTDDAIGERSMHVHSKVSRDQAVVDSMDNSASILATADISAKINNPEITLNKNNQCASSGSNSLSQDHKNNNVQNLEGFIQRDQYLDGQMEPGLISKSREVKGVEARHALRCGNNLGKRHKHDHHKELMLGKKRSRQTMFLNLEDVKQAGPIVSSTPRRQNFPAPITSRIVKENSTAPQLSDPAVNDQKQVEISSNQEETTTECSEPKHECSSDMNSGVLSKPGKLNDATDLSAESYQAPITTENSWKQPKESMQRKNGRATKTKILTYQSSMDMKLGNKKFPPRKPLLTNTYYQDSSVERLIREVTNEKFWHHPEETDLQRVPGQFESVEEYVRVFEPLLFEECRAQLYSAWEESTEAVSSDTHVRVRIKSIERRERGWYDVVVFPVNVCKWTFKEGEVAILSAPRPGSVRSKMNNTASIENERDTEISGRVAGTVRRHVPIDTRDPLGATIHFYVGDSYDSNSKVDNDHILRKLHPKDTWYLTALGSLATTQREYVALHAFRRLNLQMQTAILQPSPEHFPKYEEQTPAIPECFTPNFFDHLNRNFNGPQLSAIQWAAMHTAAGTTSGLTKRQDPWPFTLVQGPPGTGKTHTVWGMLNVIHLVQYQHYYTALLKKLAPESYKQPNESNSDNIVSGSIDAVLQNMDQNLFRTLPKLCPKPRMLVCAPSNAATDELLTRVLDRGFIDGEMKVYRPDVARVGVDTQTRAAQAVSVERRTEQLLVKSRDEVYGWMHQLKSREAQLSQQIASLQRELSVTAAAGRSQGSVGVDPDVIVARDQNRDTLMQNLAAVVENRDKTLVEMSRLVILEGRFRPGTFNIEEARANLEASFANEAEIVFTTVSSSGRKLFSRLTHGFDMVVIDEAAQASEVGVLPPLALGAARCVLVGDPQQLPATVISKAAGTLLYSRSLFERFQQAGCPTILLSVQYRMHPQIRDFPSRYFYQGRLTDSESVANLPEEAYYKDPILRPYVFYDITHGRESHRGGSVSYQNIHEAQFCVRLYEHLRNTITSLGLVNVSVGIITPYKLQLKCLQREFDNVLNSEEGKDLYINTVDAFQGQERDVIIMSCVRASSHGVGFVSDIRRMNVALTRAKRALWVMGNGNALMQSDDWAALITDAKARKCYVDMESLPKEFLLPSNPSSNTRGLRSAIPRHRSESKSSTYSENDEKLNSSYNSNYWRY